MEKRLINFAFLLISLLFVILSVSFVSATITIIAPANFTNHTGTATFNVSYVNGTDATDAVNATFYYNLSGTWTLIGTTTDCNNGATDASCNGSFDISSISEGKYSINATLNTDLTLGASVLTESVILDSTAPNVSAFYTVGNNGNYSGTITLNVSVSDGGIGVGSVYFNITYANGTQVNFTKASGSGIYYNISVDTSKFVDGRYNITVYANDTQLDNTNSTEWISVYFDNTAPTATFSCSPATVNSGDTVTCSCSGSDATTSVNRTTYTANPSTSDTGTHTVTCTVQDSAGNTYSVTASYTVELSTSGTTPSTPSVSVGEQTQVRSIVKITPRVATILKNFDKNLGVKEIQIEVKNEAQNVKISVTKYDSKPAEITVEKSGKINRYLQIKTENLKDKLEKAKLKVQVEKSWVSENNLEKENIAIFKFDETAEQWNELPTTFSEEDDNYYYYEAELSSFSYFAIGEKVLEKPSEEEQPSLREEKEIGKNLYLWMIIVGVILVTIIAIVLSKRKKKGF